MMRKVKLIRINRKDRKTDVLVFIVADSLIDHVDGYLLTNSINNKFLVKVRPFITAKTVSLYDHLNCTLRNLHSRSYMLVKMIFQ